MNFLDQKSAKTLRLLFVGLAFLVAVLHNLLTWHIPLGPGFAVSVLAYLGGFIFLMSVTHRIRQRLAFFLLVPIGILTVDVVIYNNVLVHYFLPLIICGLLFVFSALLTLQNPNRLRLAFLQLPIVRRLPQVIRHWLTIWHDLTQWKFGNGVPGTIRQVGMGILMAIPFLFLFGFLFSRADAIFSQTITNFLHISIPEEIVARLIQITFLTLCLGGFFYILIDAAYVLHYVEKKFPKPNQIIFSVFLGLLNGLFLLFVLIQIRYLFGAAPFVLEHGMTFATYARSGFFELVWVMILASVLQLVIYRAHHEHQTSSVVTLLQVVLLIQVGVVAVSALRRMHVYQDAYGFTVLRLYVEWFIYFSLAMLFLAMVCIFSRWSAYRLVAMLMIFSLVSFTIVASVNVERRIARKNITRYLEQRDVKKFDIYYLTSLSADAMDSLRILMQPNIYTGLSTNILVGLQQYWEGLRHEQDTRIKHWQSWNFYLSTCRNTNSSTVFSPSLSC